MLVSAVDKTGRRFPHNYLVCLSQGSDPYALWEINNRGVSLDTTMCKDYPRDNGTTATICVTITTGTIVQTP